jgi:peroxiredoxin (alkyl hydroperoxide reductase subunit C)
MLEDYLGQWLVLFTYPADFTPVYTTEFIVFAERHANFQALGFELLGLSTDSNFSRVASERNIKATFGAEIGFLTIADASVQLAKGCGMIQPVASDTSAVRAII